MATKIHWIWCSPLFGFPFAFKANSKSWSGINLVNSEKSSLALRLNTDQLVQWSTATWWVAFDFFIFFAGWINRLRRGNSPKLQATHRLWWSSFLLCLWGCWLLALWWHFQQITLLLTWGRIWRQIVNEYRWLDFCNKLVSFFPLRVKLMLCCEI